MKMRSWFASSFAAKKDDPEVNTTEEGDESSQVSSPAPVVPTPPPRSLG